MISSRFDLRIPFYLLIFLSVSYVLSIFLLQLFGGALAVLWLFEKNSEKRKAIDSFIIAVLVYGVTRLLSVTFSEYLENSIHTLYKEALFFLSVFSVGFYLKSFDQKRVRIIIYVFIAGAVLNSLIGFIRFNFGIVERAESLSSGYTAFSGYLTAALGITIYAFGFNEIKKKYSYINIIAIGIILAGILTSLGRANIAIAALILIISLLIKKINLKQFLFIALIAVVVSYVSFSNNLSGFTQRIESPTKLSDRDIIYKGAGELVWEHPLFGYGPRTFKKIFPFKEEFADKGIGGWHNQILQIYFESGLIGLAAYLMLLFIFFKSGYKFLK
ncbi:MAG: O-antigen ligase family protein, partial [Ignavibacteria bacterium]|nr:O-antigen ligase family protein [Ignavibacteria bacterium]